MYFLAPEINLEIYFGIWKLKLNMFLFHLFIIIIIILFHLASLFATCI